MCTGSHQMSTWDDHDFFQKAENAPSWYKTILKNDNSHIPEQKSKIAGQLVTNVLFVGCFVSYKTLIQNIDFSSYFPQL